MADLETKAPEQKIKDKKKAEERVCEETYGHNGIKKRIEAIRLQGLAYGLTEDEAAWRSRSMSTKIFMQAQVYKLRCLTEATTRARDALRRFEDDKEANQSLNDRPSCEQGSRSDVL